MTELEEVSFPPSLPTLYFHTLLTESPSRGSRSPSLKPPSFWTDSRRRFSKNGFGTRKYSVRRMRCFVRTSSGHAPNRAQLIQGLGGGGAETLGLCLDIKRASLPPSSLHQRCCAADFPSQRQRLRRRSKSRRR